jgi:ribosomal protein L7/L12
MSTADQTNAWRQQVVDALSAGNKIEAIAVYREATGASLVVAKAFVEGVAARLKDPQRWQQVTDDAFEQEVLTLAAQGQYMAAIKRYRDQHGVGLKESREAVDALLQRAGCAIPQVGCLGTIASALGMGVTFCLLVAACGWIFWSE